LPIVLSSLVALASSAENAPLKQASAIHEKVITLDTHIDFDPANLVGEPKYAQCLDTQFNLPRCHIRTRPPRLYQRADRKTSNLLQIMNEVQRITQELQKLSPPVVTVT